MKKIAIVTFSCALNGEKGLDRLYFLADLFSKNGYDVELITSRFHHWTKSFRPKEMNINREHFTVIQCDELGYEKNIQIKRILSHRVLAKNILAYLEGRHYDIVYCHIPDNHLAALVSSYAKRNHFPLIVDTEDLWPEAMRMVFNFPVVSDILFYPFARDAKRAYENASAVIGCSDQYRDQCETYGIHCEKKLTVYVGNDLARFDEGVRKFASEVDKPENEFWLTYAGTLGASYDIATLVRAAQILKEKGIDEVKVKILGDGPERTRFESVAKEKDCNVEFLGYQRYEKMAAFLSKSDVNVNSLIKSAPQGFASKIGDYLASGKPLINTGSNGEFRRAVEHEGWGLNVEAEKPEELTQAILFLKENPNLCKEMGEKARKIATQKYDRKTSYLAIIRLADSLINKAV